MTGGPQARQVDFVLVWHMHQPEYRDPQTGEFRLPWVYLHALKDYSDMAGHLEACPGMRAVVNFVPVLLDQLDDYADQFARGPLRDPLLRLLARPVGAPYRDIERELVLRQCFHANHDQLIAPYPAYKRLHALAHAADGGGRDAHGYLSDRFLDDLIVWYHLAWTGETVRRDSALALEMIEQGSGFTAAQRRSLYELVASVVSGIVARYRRLEAAGQIELSTSPSHHPIAPLLIDFASAREARPTLALPEHSSYPGGSGRIIDQWHAAIESHAQRFGRPPDGLWPPEGAISDAFVATLAGSGLRWIASGSQVLENSLRAAGAEASGSLETLHRPYRLTGTSADLVCFFRDDRLSDLIGFEYRKWHSGNAALHFLRELESILAAAAPETRPVVTVIVDGENAWEYYPYNAFFFLSGLYERLAADRAIRPVTCRELLAERTRAIADGRPDCTGELPGLVAGSWVYGDLTTWIGAAEKNRAWDLLVAAKEAYDRVLAGGGVDDARRAAATRQLAICEASDWFWWFGDVHAAASVAEFDALYRAHLAHLYELLALPAPAALGEPVSRGNVNALSEGAIRRAV